MKRSWWILLAVMIAAGCGEGKPDVAVQLYTVTGCDDLIQSIREAAIQEMSDRLDQELESYLDNGGMCRMWEDMAMPTAGDSGGGTTNSSQGASQVSSTNNQVAGVDEADFIKNDNKYIYMVSGGAFRILAAWPAPQAAEIAKLPLEGTPRKLFIAGDRALIYSSLPRSQSSQGQMYPDYRQGECTYGYSCDFTGDGNPTRITILDISDKTAPTVLRQLELSGSYVNSRRVGGAVHTMISSPAVSFEGVQYFPDSLEQCGEPAPSWVAIIAFDELRAKNTTLINQASVDGWLPTLTDSLQGGGQVNLLGQCGGFYRSGVSDGSTFTTILSMDMTADDPSAARTIVSRPGAIFSSAQALYIAVPHQRDSGWGWYGSMSAVDEASTVHKFRLDNNAATAAYAGSGVVKGRVLNQFAMDELNGYLRIATTTGHLPSEDVHSTITVLGDMGGHLGQVGQVDGLAPKEDIRSVRFDGERGYMVTFKKTDPLFVLDLSNPYYPAVLSELKIPGFSTYMHMMDPGHLLTIGYDADDQGDFAWFTGVMLQIFDVQDPFNPTLKHKEIIGTRGSSSEALTNHLAFTYFQPKDLLSLPMTICENSSGGGGYGMDMTFSGLMVYDVTVAGGFALRGQVPHATAGSDNMCSNWWTDASSKVKRSIIMDDYVYSISEDQVKVNHLNNLTQDLVVIPVGS